MKRPNFRTIMICYSVAVLAYYMVLAHDRYVSRSRFVMTRGASAGAADITTGLGVSAAQQDPYALINFIQSTDMLLSLEAKIGLREHYGIPWVDFVNRLPKGATLEDFLDYYNKRVHVKYDLLEGIITIEAEAFTPPFARELSEAIMERAEDYVNERNRDIARRQMAFFQEALAESENALAAARQRLVSFQNKHLTIDPSRELTARLQHINEARSKILFLNVEKRMLVQESPDSPKIAELAAEISALEAQSKVAALELVGDDSSQMNQLSAGFDKLLQEVQFAERRYAQSLVGVENIRVQSIQQSRFLSIIETPFVPEEGRRPRRFFMSATCLITGWLSLVALRILMMSVAEHGRHYEPS
jgi:capsular polysaccharide transport system permease protein